MSATTIETDYLIIGAGSAGCALAEGLSADARNRVTVLEAGGSDRRFWIQLPLGYGKTFFDPAVNWCYETEAEAGLNGQRMFWPRGKVLGGSSSINAMVWIRGHRADYDDWEAAGNPGWGYDDVLAVYKEMEDNEAGADQWRGTGGPVHVADVSRLVHPLTRAYIAAAESVGLAFNPDFNGAEQEGVGHYQITTANARRMSAARAYLRPAMRRANLRVETGALATAITFDGNRATGATFTRGGKTHTVRAAREVIISGGAINSPQLLQLSGIGPADVLKAQGIPVRLASENVGRNLEDHTGINYTYRATVPTYNDILRPWWGKLLVGMQYVFLRRGPLSLSINHGGGFFRTDESQPRPNMQLYFQAFSTLIPRVGERPLLTPDPYSGFSIGLSNCRASSRGSIEIVSPDPAAHPRIIANAYGTNKDISEMLDAVKFVRRIAAAEPLKSLIAEELRPGPEVQSDDDLIDDIRNRSGTVFHPSCTCRMGPDPKTSVVDPRLRVHGIGALRIADASIFPNLIAGNTNAPSIMVGRKAARIIAEDNRP